MIVIVKKSLKSFLKKLGFKLIRTKLEFATYHRLFEDLKVILSREDPVVFDVGANVGQTIVELESVFNRPIIYAFEPAAESYRQLRACGFGENVTLFDFALGANIGEGEFINYEWSTMNSFLTLDPSTNNKYRDLEIVGKETVKVSTVDLFVSNHNLERIDLLKIDTQGFDLNVLKGAISSLDSGVIKNVLIEINFIEMYQGQADAAEIQSLLSDHGLFLIEYYEKVRENHTIAWCTALFGRR